MHVRIPRDWIQYQQNRCTVAKLSIRALANRYTESNTLRMRTFFNNQTCLHPPMATSAKRKKNSGLAIRSRHKKSLFLPMESASADQISLRFRMALEIVRQGHVDASAVQCLSQVTLLTGYITDAGYGRLDEAVLSACEAGLTHVINAEPGCEQLPFEDDLLSNLTLVVNEHDRQLRQVRLQILVEASELLERHLEAALSPGDLIASRRKSRADKVATKGRRSS